MKHNKAIPNRNHPSVLLEEESNYLKNRFLANVSHELRTPLNGIIGLTQLLFDGVINPTSPEYKEFLSDMLASANHLLLLINDILDLTKIESGKMEFKPVPVDVLQLLQQTQAIFYKMLSEKKLHVEMEIDPSLRTIIIDPAKFKQILYNYISNAIKFTPEDGRITIRIFSHKNHTFCLEVRDTGIGIPENEIDNLFSEFQQLDNIHSGTGLGLALTKRLVVAQGGQVGVKSIFGKGSIFYATLPISPSYPIIKPKKTKPTSSQDTTKRVLLIEQSSPEQAQFVNQLTAKGYEVIAVPNLSQATECAEKQEFDLIILDLLLPNAKQWQILHALRPHTTNQSIPFSIQTLLEHPLSVGMPLKEFLTKPVKIDELLTTLKNVGLDLTQPRKILIVDHDLEDIARVNTLLKKQNVLVLSRATQTSALLAIEKEQPDAVLFDPFTPGIDRVNFLKRYRQTSHGLTIPLIIWTTHPLKEEERLRLQTSIQRIVLERK